MKKIKNILLVCIAFILLLGCTPTNKLKYVRNAGDGTGRNEYFNDRTEKTIQPFDYLYIKIYSLDEKTLAVFQENRYTASNVELLSYPVDSKGYIDIPFVGNIYVKDLTINEAKNKIEESLRKYLNNVSVRVRFVGNSITVLGEVNRPGSYPFFDEKITVFQALSLANDIADFGNKKNITIIREKNNHVNYSYLDLTDKKIVMSDYYYLLPNDVIIVNPVRAKYRDLSLGLLFSLIAATSAVVTIIDKIEW